MAAAAESGVGRSTCRGRCGRGRGPDNLLQKVTAVDAAVALWAVSSNRRCRGSRDALLLAAAAYETPAVAEWLLRLAADPGPSARPRTVAGVWPPRGIGWPWSLRESLAAAGDAPVAGVMRVAPTMQRPPHGAMGTLKLVAAPPAASRGPAAAAVRRTSCRGSRPNRGRSVAADSLELLPLT